jgi:putative membrane protein
MNIAGQIVVALVAFLHLGFLVLEMFLWERPTGRRVFRMSPEQARSSAVLAANQGLYNGFLAAGLLWGLWSGIAAIKIFFLVCVIVAGIYGGLTAKRSILFIQALPGLVGLALVYFSG